MQIVDASCPIDLAWIGGFFKDETAIEMAELAIKDFGFCLHFFVELTYRFCKKNIEQVRVFVGLSFVGSYTRNCLQMKSSK